MNQIDWLDRYAPGLQSLTPDEREAITHFSFLWTMFEARVLSTRASANAIVGASQRWAGNQILAAEAFSQELAYFRDRYIVDGKFTYHLDHPASSAKR